MSALDVYYEFNPKLINSLPVKDPIFSEKLLQNGMFSGDVKARVKSQPTDADAAEYFLDHVIQPPLDSGDTGPFEKLLTVMEQFNSQQLKKLASDIRQKLQDGTKTSGGDGASATEGELTITAPTFTTSPSPQSVNLTQTATFTCSATGDDMKYQWTIGSGSFPSKVTGINTNTLVIPDVRSSDDNTYSCTISNDGGSVTSDPVQLTVTERRHRSASRLLRSAEHAQREASSPSLSQFMSHSLVDMEAKVVMLGAMAVGKTSIILRYIENSFSSDVNSTIAASYSTFTVQADQRRVKFQLWDTAGHERFRSMLPMYYRKANAAIIVYDVTSLSSFEQVSEWITELKENIPNDMSLTIVGNKIDLIEQVAVPTEKGKKLAASLNATFVESSAAEDIGIRDIFVRTAIQIVEIKEKISQDNMHTGPSDTIATVPPGKPKWKCCPS